jgi:RNase P subunit RPR2
MKVLKSGKTKTNWKLEVTCRCSAVLEVSKADCTLTLDARDGDYYVCRCPECGHNVTLAADIVGG